ncbi:MAG: PEP-CTERM sorting domain-containing protein [Acidobacteria bacterium]|nr:PEP-CTERM sorting domain-containing protein [Acidobacteriota bacterium]
MRKFMLGVLLAASASLLQAALIVDNGMPDTSQAEARGIISFRTADDFTLAATWNVTSVSFWMLAQPGMFNGSVSYAFYQNSGGAPGSVLDSGTVNGVTPVLQNSVPGYIYSYYTTTFALPAPLQLTAGTYWLEVHHGSGLTVVESNNVYWGVVANSVPNGNARQSPVPNPPSGLTTSEMAFSLSGDRVDVVPVPEPSTYVVSAAGILLFGLLKRRKRG